jgi:hypothetical protein
MLRETPRSKGTMWHDEPANRPGQDPYGHLPFDQWEGHFRERIAHYEALTREFPNVEYFARELTQYKEWLSRHLAMLVPVRETDLPF